MLLPRRYVWPFGTTGTLSNRALTTHKGELRRALFVPKHGTVVSADAHGLVQVWNAATGQRRFQLHTKHKGALTAVAVDPACERLITAADDSTMIAWTLHNGQHLRTMEVFTAVSDALFRRRGYSGMRHGSDMLQSALGGEAPGTRFLADVCFANVSTSQGYVPEMHPHTYVGRGADICRARAPPVMSLPVAGACQSLRYRSRTVSRVRSWDVCEHSRTTGRSKQGGASTAEHSGRRTPPHACPGFSLQLCRKITRSSACVRCDNARLARTTLQ